MENGDRRLETGDWRFRTVGGAQRESAAVLHPTGRDGLGNREPRWRGAPFALAGASAAHSLAHPLVDPPRERPPPPRPRSAGSLASTPPAALEAPPAMQGQNLATPGARGHQGRPAPPASSDQPAPARSARGSKAPVRQLGTVDVCQPCRPYHNPEARPSQGRDDDR